MSNHNTSLNLSLLSLALVAFGCSPGPDDGAETDGTGSSTGSSTGEPTGSSTDEPTGGSTGEPTGGSTGGSTGEVACVEDDLAPSPFAGPGFDPENGGLQEPLQDTYLVSTTLLVLRPEKQQEFGESFGLMIPVLESNPGLIGYSVASSVNCGSARTLAVWRDEAAMMAFVLSDEHLAGAGKATEYSYTGTVTSWEAPRDQIPITWEVAMARIDETPPKY